MLATLRQKYHQFCAIGEIETSRTLQLLFYVISFSFFATFYGWVERTYVSISTFERGAHICPPYFPSCGEYYFIEALPYGYSQGALYVALFLVLGCGVYAAYRKDWVSAHLALLVALAWKCIWGFIFTYGALGNFDYYDMILATIWLFAREKEYFAKVGFVFFYVLASTIKIDGGWIFGNYFNSLFTGAPLFGSTAIVPYLTNLVIIMQMVGSWFLLSNRRELQHAVFVYFLLFHVYSGLIVHYRYIAVSIPALFILFSAPGTFRVKGIGKTTVFGYLLLLLLLCGQLTGILIPGDQKKTLEGNYYGLYMFEANHQCISRTALHRDDAEPVVQVRENHVANFRCDPYRYWFPLKTLCERDETITRIAWTFDHSVNGNPYERIVEVEDACALEYRPFSHNEWLRIGDEAEVLDLPVYENGFAYPVSHFEFAPALIENDAWLEKLMKIYWLLWILSLAGGIGAVLIATIKRR